MDEPEPDLHNLTVTLAAAERGDARAAGEMFTTLYRELHRLARRQLHANASGLTLGATTLLHEAYVDISARGAGFPTGPLFRLRGAGHARPHHRLRARAAGHQTRRRVPPDVARHGGRRGGAAAPRTSPGSATRSTSWRSPSPPWRSWSSSSSSAVSRSSRSPRCAASPSAPCSATGTRRGYTCTRRCASPDRAGLARQIRFSPAIGGAAMCKRSRRLRLRATDARRQARSFRGSCGRETRTTSPRCQNRRWWRRRPR